LTVKECSLLVFAFSRERELVLRLAIWDLVDTEPLICGPEEARKVTLHILNIIKLRGQRVVHVNDNDLPVGLLLVKKSHNTQNLDLLDLTSVSNGLTDLANVERVVVTLGLSLWVDGGRVFPSLGESTVVPEVTLVREAVADKPDLSLLYVLLDGVEKLLLGDL
jgi:hypothetical protein